MPNDSIEVTRMKGAKAAFGATRPAEFGKAAAAAPFSLRSLGLGSGVASLAAAGGEQKKLAAMVARWLLRDCPHYKLSNPELAGNADDDDWIEKLLEAIAWASRNEYRAAQSEAMGYIGWIKKLAKAFCPDGDQA